MRTLRRSLTLQNYRTEKPTHKIARHHTVRINQSFIIIKYQFERNDADIFFSSGSWHTDMLQIKCHQRPRLL